MAVWFSPFLTVSGFWDGFLYHLGIVRWVACVVFFKCAYKQIDVSSIGDQ